MVDCSREDIRDLLPDLVHGQLGSMERARVEQHLSECADCAAEMELLRSLRATAFAAPDVDVERIAAAVRTSMAPSGTAAARDSDGGVVPIDAARRRVGSTAGTGDAAGAAPVGGAGRHAARRRDGIGIPLGWRIAAGMALVAAGAGGYALTTGGAASLQRPAEQVAREVAERSTSGAASAASANRGAAKAAAPAAGAPMMASDLAAGAAGTANDAAATAAPLILGDGLNELSESDMQALLQSVDDLEAMPDLEPRQLPLLASVVEGAL